MSMRIVGFGGSPRCSGCGRGADKAAGEPSRMAPYGSKEQGGLTQRTAGFSSRAAEALPGRRLRSGGRCKPWQDPSSGPKPNLAATATRRFHDKKPQSKLADGDQIPGDSGAKSSSTGSAKTVVQTPSSFRQAVPRMVRSMSPKRVSRT